MRGQIAVASRGAFGSAFAFIWTLNKPSSLAPFFAFLCGYSVLWLQPLGVERAGFVGAFVGMRAEIIALGL